MYIYKKEFASLIKFITLKELTLDHRLSQIYIPCNTHPSGSFTKSECAKVIKMLNQIQTIPFNEFFLIAETRWRGAYLVLIKRIQSKAYNKLAVEFK